MKKIVAAIAVLAGVIHFTAFRTNDAELKYNAYFWMTSDPATKYSLYVEKEYKGTLPYIPDSLTGAGNTSVKKMGLAVSFQPGTYHVTVKDPGGKTTCTGTIILESKKGTKNITNSWNSSKCRVEIALEAQD